jgi:putative hydrolase of the HAD superfamily
MKKKHKIRALIFDLDDTLINFFAFKRAATKAAVMAMIKHGLRVNKTRAIKLLWTLYYHYGFEYRSIFQEFLKRVGHNPNDLKMIASAVVAYREARARSLKAYPAVRSTLCKLHKRGYILWLVTDAPGLKAWIRLSSVGLENIFDRVITYDDTRAYKSTGKPLKFALQLLNEIGIQPKEIMVVGDSGSRDILPAKKLGMITAMAVYGRENPSRIKADYELESIKDLLKICK